MRKFILFFLLIIGLLSTGCGEGGVAYSSSSSVENTASQANESSSEAGSSNSEGTTNNNSSINKNKSNEKGQDKGSEKNNDSGKSSRDTIDPDTQTLAVFYRAIADGKINGWDGAKSEKEYYLALTNYLRSLPIKCNDEHAYEGPVKPLKWSDRLADAAKEHSDDMLNKNYFDHYGSDGSSPVDRIKDNGFVGRGYGENIAYQKNNGIPYTGYEWLVAFVKWIQSRSGHCSNIMNPNFEYVGMAQSKSVSGRKVTLYWTQDFGVK